MPEIKQNIPILSKILLFDLKSINFNEMPGATSIDFDSIIFYDSYDPTEFNHTIGTASFSENEKQK